MNTGQHDPETAISRIVVTLTGADNPSSLIDLAILVATIFRAELSGLYVEEETLLDLSDLPAAIIDRSGAGGPKHLGKDKLRSVWRRQARGFREHLLVHANRHQLRCSFTTKSGDMLSCLAQAAHDHDLVAVPGGRNPAESQNLWGMVRAAARSAQGVMISARQFVPEPGAPIVAIDDRDAPSASTIRFAAAIASATQRPLHVLALAEPDEADCITAWAGGLAGSVRPVVHPLSVWARDRISAALARLRPMLIVADLGGAPFEDETRARRLLSALDASLILLAPGERHEEG